MSRLERRVLDAVNVDALLDTLGDLIRFESLGGNEFPIQDRMATLLENHGFDVDRWEIPLNELRQHPAYSADIEREQAIGVVGRWGNGESPTLVLNGHVDVVPAGELDLWHVPPWEMTIADNRVYGRGSVDMKGGLCCALSAIRALQQAGVELNGQAMLQSVVGEEDGGIGTLATIERGHIGDAAIVMEPTELMVAPAQAGALNFRLTVPGKAAHGALRGEGVSPFDKYLLIYDAMRGFEAERNRALADPLFDAYDVPFALCIGRVWSGVWASTVAESLTCEGRVGVAPDEDPDDVRRAFGDVIAQAADRDPWLKDHPPQLEWWGAQFAPASTDPEHALPQTLMDAHRSVTGDSPIVRGMPYGADMRLLVNEGGMPTVIYGPGDVRRAHAPDEYVPIADLENATRALALTLCRFCGVAD